MKRNTIAGLLIGIAAGILDVTLMLIQNIPWNANISAFSMWVVIGYLLSISSFRFKGIVKGLTISFLILIPHLFIIGWEEPLNLIPIVIMTAILGSLAGFFYQKIVKE